MVLGHQGEEGKGKEIRIMEKVQLEAWTLVAREEVVTE
jgi:hypothetical protein